MTEDQLDQQVIEVSEYLCKKGNLGFEHWLKSKGFTPDEEDYIRTSMGYLR